MHKIFFTTLLTLSSSFTGYAATHISTKDAYKAVLSLTAYDQNNKPIRQATAFFVDNQGTAVTSYNALKDAWRVEVTDAKGKHYELYRILGANTTTDLAKFSVKDVKKNSFLNITTSAAERGASLLLMRYTTEKKHTPLDVTITKDEAFDKYRYYYVSAANDSINFACPLVDSDGNLVAIVQQNVNKEATRACAIDARFVNELTITSTAAINTDLTALHLPKALPANAKDALTYLYLLPLNDSTACITTYADYIATYPEQPEGYVQRATFYAAKNQIELAESEFAVAINKAKVCKDSTAIKEDAIRNTMSRIIYNKVMEQGKDSTLTAGWTLSRAEQEADKAYMIQPSALYMVQKGNCQYAQRKYNEAYKSFFQACQDKQFVSCETFFSAARSLELTEKPDIKEIIALLDSCIAYIPSQNKARYAQFYFERSQRLLKAQEYRKAVADYNEYEQLVGPRNLTDQFYYMRSKAEEKAHMYQQALDDLHTAIATSKQPMLYQLDEAILLLNIGEYQKAITAAEELLKTLPENPDCYKVLGVAHGELKHKVQAIQYLKKAQELGDDTVATFIEKYK